MTKSTQRGSRLVTSVVIVLVVLAAACGSSDDPEVAGAADIPDTTVDAAVNVATAEPEPTSTPAPPAPGWTDPAGSTIRFSDVTGDVGMDVSHASPFGSEKDGAEMMGGAAAGDFNNDGWQDLFFIGGGTNPDALFINSQDGTFEDMAVSAGIAEGYVGSGATVGDFDGDGWLDIFVTSHGTADQGQVPGKHRLYRNNGDLTFTDVAEQAGVNMTSREVSDGFGSAFGDYDLDGDLDLFVSGWVRDALGNRLFRNDGDGTFTDVTEDAGIVDDGIRGFSPCIVDTDGDRYPEILLVADFGTTKYFRNMADGTFLEGADLAGTEQIWSGMGTTVGDFNRDGLVDWYTTEIFDDEQSGRGVGNKLYLNRGDHSFEEVAAASGVADGGWGWGTVAVDLNLDGLLDLVETNGWRLPAYDNEMAKVWIQTPDSTFAEVANDAGLRHDQFGLSVVHFDIDNDGDQDIAITSGNDAFHVYETEIEGTKPSWLRVLLDTSERPDLAPNGIGSVVRVDVGGESQYEHVVSCANYLSTSELTAHFGLGGAESVDRIVVEWPDGSTTELTQVDANQTLTIAPSGG